MEKVLVTGGCGLIGQHICSGLLKKGYEVIAVDREESGYNEGKLHYSSIQCDLTDKNAIAEVFENNKFDVVIHAKDFNRTSSNFSNLNIENKEVLSVFYTALSQSSGLLNISLKYQIQNVERTSQYYSAKLTFPTSGIVKNVVLDFTNASAGNEAKFVESKRKDSVVVTPETINFQVAAKLCMVIKDNPIEFLNSVVANQSSGLNINMKLQNSPALEMVLDSSGDSNLDFLLKDSDLVLQFDSVFVDDISKLGNFENLSNVQDFKVTVDSDINSKLEM